MARKKLPEKKKPLGLDFSYLYLRHFDQVLQIEEESFEYPWERCDFTCHARQRNCLGRVAKHEEEVVGFMVYELHKTHFLILNFAVRSDFLRQGVGTQLMENMIEDRVNQRRNHITIKIHEDNKTGRDFLTANSYYATSLLRNYWEGFYDPHYDSGDAYLMRRDYVPRPRFERTKT